MGSFNQPLLTDSSSIELKGRKRDEDDRNTIVSKVWIETRKLWHIVGPSIFSRVAMATMNIITQAFAGHLGDVELAAITIANTVIVGFNFGLLLGMASALETLCGQAFGAKKYYMLGIYMQRSWIVLLLGCFLTLPLYFFATPMLKLLRQPDDVAELSGVVALWLIPLHFNFAFQFSMQRFLQSQLKTQPLIWVSFAGLAVNALTSWLFVTVLDFGVVGAALALDLSFWVTCLGLYGYIVLGGCPLTWTGFSMEAFSDLWEFIRLSIASGVMLWSLSLSLSLSLSVIIDLFFLCSLENWYYRILILMTGYLNNATIAVGALSVCMTINGWEMMIPVAFLAAIGVRVANELGSGNGKAAKFATKVAVGQSTIIGIFFGVLIMIFRHEISLIFSSSADVLQEVDKLSFLLAFSILLNSVQPVLSGVAVGSGWQATVAYVNLGCYYIIGLPLGFLMGWVFHTGVAGIWGGMIFGGTAVQTLILAIITIKCNWEKEAQKAKSRMLNSSTPSTKEPLLQ